MPTPLTALETSLFDLTGAKALVTGGASGVGRASALALASAGADVAIVDRDGRSAKLTADEIGGLGRDATVVTCDVTDPESVQAMAASVVDRFGRLDVAVNAAGAFRHGDDETHTVGVWEQVVGVNLTGTWLCAKAEMQYMAEQQPAGGKIINIASIAGSRVCSNGSYDASKAAVVHLTRVLAVQWGMYNINVNSVSPGYVVAAFRTTRPAEERQRIRDVTPLGHVQRLEDLHGPILFFASRASDYVTGQDLVVDGGHSLSSGLQPLERSIPPRVDPAGEVAGIKHDLDVLGIPHDDDGIPM